MEKRSEIILVVDDDEMVRKTLSMLVESFGYNCLVAEDGEEALRILGSTRIDLVLSDVVMPGMDGLELLRAIRKSHPDTDVIMATGFQDKATYAEVIQIGAIDFIKKPIDQAELDAKFARAIRERQMVRKLAQLSQEDGLTGLYNRRAFSEKFSYEVDRADRQHYSLMLAILDIDHFKEFNDTYGHPAGDDVLIGLAEILKECTRDRVDMCFRLGGDEFAVLLPQATPDQGTEIVQRILLSYLEHGFGATTLSIGLVACKRDVSRDRDEDDRIIHKLADEMMYQAKTEGGNTVVTKI